MKKNVLTQKFLKCVLALVLGVCLTPLASADPAVPFPWGRAHEVKFPWEQAKGEWILLPGQVDPIKIVIRSRKDVAGQGHLVVRTVDVKTGQTLSVGRVSQTELNQTRVPVILTSSTGHAQVITFVQYQADTGETAFVAKVDGFISLASTFVLTRLK